KVNSVAAVSRRLSHKVRRTHMRLFLLAESLLKSPHHTQHASRHQRAGSLSVYSYGPRRKTAARLQIIRSQLESCCSRCLGNSKYFAKSKRITRFSVSHAFFARAVSPHRTSDAPANALSDHGREGPTRNGSRPTAPWSRLDIPRNTSSTPRTPKARVYRG